MPEYEVTKTVTFVRRIEAETREKAVQEMETVPIDWYHADMTVEAEEVSCEMQEG